MRASRQAARDYADEGVNMRNSRTSLAVLSALAIVSLSVAGPAMAQRKSAQEQRKQQTAEIQADADARLAALQAVAEADEELMMKF